MKYWLILIGVFQGMYAHDQAHLALGGGYFDAGPRHSGGIAHVEYQARTRYFTHVRPQASLILPELRSLFLGAGLGLEVYLKEYLVVTPSFSPGLYCKGNGKDLGFPIEFRTSIEAALECRKGVRFVFQYYHISNASLSSRNPGGNAVVVLFGLPFGTYYPVSLCSK